MKVFISNKEIEEIASGLIQAACGSLASGPIDIDGIARFLNLQIQYGRGGYWKVPSCHQGQQT